MWNSALCSVRCFTDYYAADSLIFQYLQWDYKMKNSLIQQLQMRIKRSSLLNGLLKGKGQLFSYNKNIQVFSLTTRSYSSNSNWGQTENLLYLLIWQQKLRVRNKDNGNQLLERRFYVIEISDETNNFKTTKVILKKYVFYCTINFYMTKYLVMAKCFVTYLKQSNETNNFKTTYLKQSTQ